MSAAPWIALLSAVLYDDGRHLIAVVLMVFAVFLAICEKDGEYSSQRELTKLKGDRVRDAPTGREEKPVYHYQGSFPPCVMGTEHPFNADHRNCPGCLPEKGK